MTGFDAFAILVILASAAAGWVRGGLRELITLVSFVVAAFLAAITLPLTAPLGRSLIDPDWIGSIFAVILSFLVLYFGIRLIGGLISKRTHEHPQLGALDRLFGVIIGGVRALVLIGAVHLVVVAALPGERTPRWLTQAVVYPVSVTAARAIQIVLPGLGRGVDALSPMVGSSVRRGFSDDQALQTPPTNNTSPPDAVQ